MENRFWEKWNKKSEREVEAINSLKEAIELVKDRISEEEIVSIYVKGSFIRREMVEGSDVDVLVVLKSEKSFGKLLILGEEFKERFRPPIQLSKYLIDELRSGKRIVDREGDKASPRRVARHLEFYKRVYGQDLGEKKLDAQNDREGLEGMVTAFRDVFLPKYRKEEFGFSRIVKQTLWLVWNAQRFKGRDTPYSWNEVTSAVEDNHIAHKALKYREEGLPEEKKRKEYIEELELYLSEVEGYL